MSRKSVSIELVGDVLTHPLAPISSGLPEFDVALRHHAIDQHFQALLSEAAPDVLIAHARAEFFGAPDASGSRIAAYREAIEAFAGRGTTLVILNTVIPPLERIVGMAHVARRRNADRINDMIYACAETCPMVAIADLGAVLTRVGADRALNVQNDLVMRMPYTGHALPAVVAEYVRVIRERLLPRKKALLVDADNTLWGGIVGEDGINNLAIDNQFPGIVHRRFQEGLIEARSSGILLGLVSKNNEADVRQAFEELNMPLKWEHLAVTRVNWQSKSDNIEAIAAELNIGLDAIVFVDDNQFELEEVRHALPNVDCYRFDAKRPDEALKLLPRIKDLGSWSVTDEDLQKSHQYAHEAQRRTVLQASGSLQEYLQSLGLKIRVGVNRESQVKRISQLTNKTNQFNLTTRRYSEAEVMALMKHGTVYDFTVVDKFGDMGIVGVVIVRDGDIDTFLMSCRALGREVESHMLKYVRDAMAPLPLTASYIATAKNSMVADFYDRNGFEVDKASPSEKHYRCVGPPPCAFPIEVVEVT
jgi:FkbH-like protein